MAEAMAAIDDGARVYVSPLCSVPASLVEAMAEARDRWRHIELITDYLIEPLTAFDHPGAPFHLTSLQPSRAVEPMSAAGALSTIPATYSRGHALSSGAAASARDEHHHSPLPGRCRRHRVRYRTAARAALGARPEALASIAHPDFRNGLLAAASA